MRDLSIWLLPILLLLSSSTGANRQTHWSKFKFVEEGLLASHNEGVKRVAIIGAGAGGSSAAYFLNKSIKEKYPNLQLEIDVFEKSDRIGGRVESKFFGTDEEKIELGANAFVNENYNLMNASKEFGITFEENGRGDGVVGLYDGSEFIAKVDDSYKKKFNFFYRYGWGLYRANKFATQIKDQFLKLYDESQPPFESIEEMLRRTNLLNYMYRTTEEVLMKDWHAGAMFTKEFLPAISRNIYASGGNLHSLSGAIVLTAVAGSHTTSGGNSQFFEGYLNHSNANLFLNSPVTDIKKVTYGDEIYYTVKVNEIPVDKLYHSVILATPFHQSGINLDDIQIHIPQVEYRQVHVAIVEDSLINPTFFNLKADEEVPNVILGFNTSYPYTVISHSPHHRRVTIEGTIPITLDSLTPILQTTPHYDQITIKNWLAYPVMRTLKKSSPVHAQIPPITLSPSLYYVNAIESAISCMEVEILAARNIVRMVVNDLTTTSHSH